MVEPVTDVVLETAAGLIRTRAHCRNGRCERVTIEGVPSFVEALDVALDVPGLGGIRVDVAYGGCYYVLVDAAALGVSSSPRLCPRCGRTGDGCLNGRAGVDQGAAS